jgi:hypothetical protein
MEAHERFLEVFRRGQRHRYVNVPGLVGAVAAAIHLLRGQREQADIIEQRVGRVPPQFELIVAHALLGSGDPELALERASRVPFSRVWVQAITAEAQAALGRWDDLDATLARLDAMQGIDQLPRALAQIDRARGIAGDELALARAEREFERLGCLFEQARCQELMGQAEEARRIYELLGAEPALGRCAPR